MFKAEALEIVNAWTARAIAGIKAANNDSTAKTAYELAAQIELNRMLIDSLPDSDINGTQINYTNDFTVEDFEDYGIDYDSMTQIEIDSWNQKIGAIQHIMFIGLPKND